MSNEIMVATVMDVNGVLLNPKKGKNANFVNLPLDHDPRMLDRFFKSMDRQAEEVETVEERMQLITQEIIEILDLEHPLSGSFIGDRIRLPSKYRLLTPPYLRYAGEKAGKINLLGKNISRPGFTTTRYNAVFDDYDENKDQTKAFKDFVDESRQEESSQKNQLSLVCTGISYGDRVRFARELDFLLDYIDFACLRPGREARISGSHTKPVLCGLLYKYGYEVLLGEDDGYVSLCVSLTSPTAVYNPNTKYDCDKQTHIDQLKAPDKIINGPPKGNIIYQAKPNDLFDHARGLLKPLAYC